MAVIVHLSDLHFCDKFQNTKAFPSSLIGSAGHHYKFLVALDRIFSKIPQQIQEMTKLRSKPRINLLVVTGDLTTRATPKASQEVIKFLTGFKRLDLKGPNIGLRMTTKVLLVPGNHDTLRKKILVSKKHLKAYKNCFRECPYLQRKKYNGKRFLFIGVDSNKTRNLLKGKVDQMELEEIGKKLENISKKNVNVLKIVLLHHHPWVKKPFKHRLAELKDYKDVRNKLSDIGVDIVLCGHEHVSFEDPWSPPYGQDRSNLFLSCAGTASQIDKKNGNSFKVYLFFKNGMKRIEYIYDNVIGKFKPTKPYPLSYPNSPPL